MITPESTAGARAGKTTSLQAGMVTSTAMTMGRAGSSVVATGGALQIPIPDTSTDSGSRGRWGKIAQTVFIRAAVFIRDLAVSMADLAAVLGVVAAVTTEIRFRS